MFYKYHAECISKYNGYCQNCVLALTCLVRCLIFSGMSLFGGCIHLMVIKAAVKYSQLDQCSSVPINIAKKIICFVLRNVFSLCTGLSKKHCNKKAPLARGWKKIKNYSCNYKPFYELHIHNATTLTYTTHQSRPHRC